MKVLVTGHKGFIGQNMCKAIQKEGWKLATFDISDDPNVRPKDLNFDDVNCVVHLGAISSTTETDIRKIMDLNLSWSIEMLEECRERGVNMQFASSASVYGQNRNARILNEEDICYPANYYALSKYMFEKYALKRPQVAAALQIFRYFNVYGPHEEHKGSQASPYTQFAKQAKETGVIKVFKGSDKFTRDFVHVDTVVDAHLAGINRMDLFSGGVYNVGSGYSRSFLDVAKDISLLHNAEIKEIPFPDNLKEHYQYHTQANIKKLNSLLFY
jgi:ADP-L-glycero-D-manno-heptose 6-epimerase